MATPDTYALLSFGNRDGIVGSFSALNNADTWATGMSKIEHVSITNGTSGVTVGYTVSGGIITFALSGALANATVLALGFK